MCALWVLCPSFWSPRKPAQSLCAATLSAVFKVCVLTLGAVSKFLVILQAC